VVFYRLTIVHSDQITACLLLDPYTIQYLTKKIVMILLEKDVI